jgi:hypothetical protein
MAVRFGISVGILALTLFTVPVQAANILTNGTFNTDSAGWTLGGGCASGVWDSSGNPGGSILLNACGESTSDPFAMQTVGGLTIGGTYQVSVDIHFHVALSPNGHSFGIFLDNEPGNPLLTTEPGDSNWHTVSVNFNATSSTHTIAFAAELDPRTPGVGSVSDTSYFIDNASLTLVSAPGVPEPGMFWLLAGGLSTLLLAPRKLSRRQ